MTITPEDIARDKALCEAVPEPPWQPEIGTHAMCVLDRDRNQIAAAQGTKMANFIAAARERWPLYIEEIETLTGFLGLLDSAGVTMNGMKPTEALEKLRKIAA